MKIVAIISDPLEEANAGVQGINMFKQECLEKEDTKIGYQKKTGKVTHKVSGLIIYIYIQAQAKPKSTFWTIYTFILK